LVKTKIKLCKIKTPKVYSGVLGQNLLLGGKTDLEDFVRPVSDHAACGKDSQRTNSDILVITF
jgi:hypothetical protein